ncbi:MAG: hypothetical protein ABI693_02585 [Bryobacteraceae bacterium]
MPRARMANNQPDPLPVVLQSLALSAVEVQLVYDRECRTSVTAAAPALEVLTGVIGRDAGISLLPPCLKVRRWDVSTSVMLTRSSTKELALLVRPVNLAFRLKYGTSQTVESRLSVEVEQVSVPSSHSISKDPNT